MQSTKSVTCPVCGRPNRSQDQCTFCGASLKDVVSAAPGTRAADTRAGPLGVPPYPTAGTGYPPSPPGQTQGWQEPALAPKFGGFWIRTVAYSIDGFLVQLIYALLLGVGFLGYTSGSDTDALSDFSQILFETNFSWLNILSTVIYLAYFTVFLGMRGQTPGKMICGLRVVRLDGTPVSYGQAALRTLGYYLNLLTLCIGFLWVAFDPRKQGLHDKIAGTYEIRVGLAEIRGWQPPPPT